MSSFILPRLTQTSDETDTTLLWASDATADLLEQDLCLLGMITDIIPNPSSSTLAFCASHLFARRLLETPRDAHDARCGQALLLEALSLSSSPLPEFLHDAWTKRLPQISTEIGMCLAGNAHPEGLVPALARLVARTTRCETCSTNQFANAVCAATALQLAFSWQDPTRTCSHGSIHKRRAAGTKSGARLHQKSSARSGRFFHVLAEIARAELQDICSTKQPEAEVCESCQEEAERAVSCLQHCRTEGWR